MQFQSLEQRMLHTYVDTFPPFVPLREAPASEESQRQLHAFFEGMYQRFAADPSIWFSELHEDDAHPYRFNKAAYGKPKLIVDMRKVLKTVDSFLGVLFSLGKEGSLEGNILVLGDTKGVSRKHRAVMAELGLKLGGLAMPTSSALPKGSGPSKACVLSHDDLPEMFAAWKWMASRPGASMLAFSRCMFDPDHSYMRDVYRRLSGCEGAFDMLERYLLEADHQLVDRRDGGLTVDYVKCRGDAGAKLGHPAYDHNYTGIAADYDHVIVVPQYFMLRILRMRDILPMFDRMDEDLKDFVIEHNQRCHGCDFCIQRHKARSSAVKRFCVVVEHRGKRYGLCPLFPGHSYCWTSLDEKRVKGIIASLSFMERELFAT